MAFAQERKDYREAMGKVVECYNNNSAACLSGLFTSGSSNRGIYSQSKVNQLRTEMREIVSYKYMRQREDGMIIFKVTFARYHGPYKDLYRNHKGCVGLRLDKNKKITRLSLPTMAYPPDHPHYALD